MFTAWTIGDINGIGPEIILKSFREIGQGRNRPLVIGSAEALRFYTVKLGLGVNIAAFTSFDAIRNASLSPDTLPVLSVSEPSEPIVPGTISAYAGDTAMKALDTASRLCLEGNTRALVTAPIHKEALAKAGYTNTGHTDYLAERCGETDPIMLFHDPFSSLTVALATIHVPLRRVPGLIESMDFERFFAKLFNALRTDFRIPAPRIAVLGLNPHASDGGVMGNEERAVLQPCIQKIAEKEHIDGPFAADGFFGARRYNNYDAVVAMYHDQGLLPFKVLAFESGINVTIGLPIVRTSPDHGTGFDIAGLGKASSKSFIEAALLAEQIADNRERKSKVNG